MAVEHSPCVNGKYRGADFADLWSVSTNSNSIVVDPFKVCHVDDLCCSVPENFFNDLRRQLLEAGYSRQDSDLFSYSQAKCDLTSVELTAVQAAVKFLVGPVREWLAKLTGIALNETVTLTSSIYEKGDYLLCHDDEVRDRRIAFIWYLMEPGWTAADGGLLQLFSTDDEGDPADVTQSFVPKENSFAFFPISPRSYHQVSEVLADKKRISINGWFHGEPLDVPECTTAIPKAIPVKPCQITEEGVVDWVNPIYIDPAVQEEIRATFLEQSEIQLADFLKAEKFEAVLKELTTAGSDAAFSLVGPPSKQRFWKFSPSTSDYEKFPNVQHCLQLLRSDAMFLILSQLTGLHLHPLASTENWEWEEQPGNGSENGEKAGCSSKASDEPPKKAPRIEENNGGAKNGEKTGSSSEGSDEPPKKAPRIEENGGSERTGSDESAQPSLTCCGSLRKWDTGSYTLVHNHLDDEETCLDLQFAICADGWEEENGGYSVYLDKTDGEELIRFVPKPNCVALVYREAGTVGFKKYVNRSADGKCHFDFAFSYFE